MPLGQEICVVLLAVARMDNDCALAVIIPRWSRRIPATSGQGIFLFKRSTNIQPFSTPDIASAVVGLVLHLSTARNISKRYKQLCLKRTPEELNKPMNRAGADVML